jgi:ADP-ribose pyrophosphatase YjhB (NUDIX family)
MITDEVKYCSRCGAEVVQAVRFGRQRAVCPQCGWIHFVDPKVAVAVLVLDQGKVLLVRRTNEPYRGFWTLPAGFVDAGEDPAEAVVRECLEETGLQVRVTALLDILAGQEHPRGAHILIVYRGEILSGELKAGDDADQAGFFTLQGLPPLAFNSTWLILKRWVTAS